MTQQDITALTTMLTDMQTQLQGEFDKINDRLDAHDARFFAIESRMATREDLAQYVTKAEFDGLRVTLDKILANTEVNTHERVALSAQVTRHEDWVVAAAPVVGVPYTPGA